MKSEMGYRFKGSGFEAPEEKKEYQEPNDKLKQAFQWWLHTHAGDRNELYQRACEFLDGIEATAEEANALLISCQKPRGDEALFVSAVYSKAKEKEIIFDVDLDTPPQELGFRLPKDKVLIAKANTGHYLGFQSEGMVINYANTGEQLGYFAKGSVINYGKAGSRIEEVTKETTGLFINMGTINGNLGYGLVGAVLNLGTAQTMMGDYKGVTLVDLEGLHVNPIDLPELHIKCKHYAKVPKVRKYLDELISKLEAGRADHQAAIKTIEDLGPEPAQKITADLKKALGWRYWVPKWLRSISGVFDFYDP